MTLKFRIINIYDQINLRQQISPTLHVHRKRVRARENSFTETVLDLGVRDRLRTERVISKN